MSRYAFPKAKQRKVKNRLIKLRKLNKNREHKSNKSLSLFIIYKNKKSLNKWTTYLSNIWVKITTSISHSSSCLSLTSLIMTLMDLILLCTMESMTSIIEYLKILTREPCSKCGSNSTTSKTSTSDIII